MIMMSGKSKVRRKGGEEDEEKDVFSWESKIMKTCDNVIWILHEKKNSNHWKPSFFFIKARLIFEQNYLTIDTVTCQSETRHELYGNDSGVNDDKSRE